MNVYLHILFVDYTKNMCWMILVLDKSYSGQMNTETNSRSDSRASWIFFKLPIRDCSKFRRYIFPTKSMYMYTIHALYWTKSETLESPFTFYSLIQLYNSPRTGTDWLWNFVSMQTFLFECKIVLIATVFTAAHAILLVICMFSIFWGFEIAKFI